MEYSVASMKTETRAKCTTMKEGGRYIIKLKNK